MARQRVAIVGAGIAGLASAVDLAARGVEVVVLERAGATGGKMRQLQVGDARIDAGPTVLTLRWVFDELFDDAGASFAAAAGLRRADLLARHAWSEHERLDLFADVERSAEQIGELAGPGAADGYRRFSERACAVYQTLEGPFLRASRPSPLGLVRTAGLSGLGDLTRIRPFSSLWRALGDYFPDPRLRQLFGRYATYVGSSPFASPATLMLIAHVERDGVWLVDGGMQQVALALERLATRLGARFRLGEGVTGILDAGGRAAGVELASGERMAADAVVLNADAGAIAAGGLGPVAARAVPRRRRAVRSLSAVTWALHARVRGLPLQRHNVFFSRDYPGEFDDLFRRQRLPQAPTVYLCAQDRGVEGPAEGRPERLLCLVNAPPTGDRHAFTGPEMESCEEATFRLLMRCGLEIARSPETSLRTTPAGFEQLFPGTGGALYGAATHGWSASFRRPGAHTSLPGLHLAGGSSHPGAGVPMAALSGRRAAEAVLAYLPGRSPAEAVGAQTGRASTARSRRVGTPGGTSMD